MTSRQVTEVGNSLIGKPFSIENAKDRITNDYMASKFKKKLISLGVSEDDAEIVAPYFCTASVCHALGDEHRNSDAKWLLEEIKNFNIASPIVYDNLNSMLLDISNYGNAERENQTDDLSLVINLDSNITSIQNVTCVKTSKESAVWYTLGGLQIIDKPMLKGLYIRKGKKIIFR